MVRPGEQSRVYCMNSVDVLINGISQEADAGGKYTIIHVSHEFAFRFERLFGNFIGKDKNSKI